MPNPGSLFICRGPKTYAVSWRTENQIVNSSYHKNSPDPVEGYWLDYPQPWCSTENLPYIELINSPTGTDEEEESHGGDDSREDMEEA
jgi:hypothetical protein